MMGVTKIRKIDQENFGIIDGKIRKENKQSKENKTIDKNAISKKGDSYVYYQIAYQKMQDIWEKSLEEQLGYK